jgi:hypothetical protein
VELDGAELGAAVPEIRAGAALLHNGDADVEPRHFLFNRFHKPLDPPLVR